MFAFVVNGTHLGLSMKARTKVTVGAIHRHREEPDHITTCSAHSPKANNVSRKAGLAVASVVTAALIELSFMNGTNILPTAFGASISMRLPPIDRTDARRCEPTSSAIGQANAARDKLLDLRECDLRNKDMSGFDLSGGLFANANVENANLKDAQLSKSYAPNANFRNVDFTNAIVDRVTFDNTDLSNAIFGNAVLSDSTFDGANLENVDFTDVYIGDFALRNICRNPTTKGENPVTGAPTRESLGCR